MTVQCGATEFSWVSGFNTHLAHCRRRQKRLSRLLYAFHKCGTSDHPPRAWPTPRLPRDRPARRAGVQWVAPAADTRTPGGRGGEAASAPAVSRVGVGSSGVNWRAGGPSPEAAGARRAGAAATGAPRPPTRPSRRPAGLYLQRRPPSPRREARARPPFPAGQAELAGRTD